MIRDDDEWFSLTDAFMSAALGIRTWHPALERLADATGSAAAQLIELSVDGSVAYNLFTGLDPEIHVQYLAQDRARPVVNPRARASHHARVLRAVAESDFISAEEHANDPHYNEFARPWNIPYSCLVPVARDARSQVVLAVFRTEAQGHIGAKERAHFEAASGHVHGALRAQRALADQASGLAAGTLDALSLAAFVCTVDGRVTSITRGAEAAAPLGDFLLVSGGMLQAANPRDAAALAEAIRRAGNPLVRPGPPVATALLLHARRDPVLTIAVDVFRMPGTPAETEARVLVVVRGARRRRGDLAPLLRHACGLTEAEADVALALADGKDLEEIAGARRVGVATIRSQMKSLFAKLGVRRQAELVARLQSLR